LLTFQVATFTSTLALLQVRLDVDGLVANGFDGSLELVGGHAELLRPVTNFVVFTEGDVSAVLTASLALVVRHAMPPVELPM
jgi:hypothetical protein